MFYEQFFTIRKYFWKTCIYLLLLPAAAHALEQVSQDLDLLPIFADAFHSHSLVELNSCSQWRSAGQYGSGIKGGIKCW